jgi:hypothetical protein
VGPPLDSTISGTASTPPGMLAYVVYRGDLGDRGPANNAAAQSQSDIDCGGRLNRHVNSTQTLHGISVPPVLAATEE